MLRETVTRAIGPRATSQTLVLIVVVVLSLSNIASNASGSTQELMFWLGIISVSGMLSWMWFVLWSFAARGSRGAIRIGLLSFIFATTEVLRTLSVHVLATSAGLENATDWVFYVVAGALYGLTFFVFVSIILNDIDLYRASFLELADRQQVLRSLLRTAEAQFDAVREATRAAVQSGIKLAVDRAFETAGRRETSQVVAEMMAISNEVVRPMAHELFDGPVRLELPRTAEFSPRVSFRRVINGATTVRPIRPQLIVVLYVLLASPSAILLATSWMSVGWFLISIFVLWLLAELGRRVMLVARRWKSLALRVALLVSCYTVLGLGTGVVYGMSEVRFGSIPMLGVLTASFVSSILIGAWLSVSAGIDDARAEILAQLTVATEQLHWQQVQMQSRIWAEQRRMARLLHSQVQSAIVAGALRFRSAVDDGADRAEALHSFQKLVNDAVAKVLAGEDRPQIDVLLAASSAQWDGVLDVHIAVDDATLVALQSDSVASAVVAEVVTNALLNCVKHARAASADVRLRLLGDTVLRVEVIDDGVGVPATVIPGMGMRQLQALSLSCSLKTRRDRLGAVLEADIPVCAAVIPRVC